MLVTEYTSQNYRLKTCTESDHSKIERISPRQYIGYLQMHANDGRLEICDLWIHEEPENFRGKGFGSILINHAFEYASERDIDFVFGHTAFEDHRVHRFYQACGFEIFLDDKHGTAWFIRSLKGELTGEPDIEQLAAISGLKQDISALD
ncbi:GNAT family N-acetyltransferase [Pseudoalteromonas rubra]|uniref:GNAT family N-acetyltransferase n=1 Tax=Pseudoalteromonas rubra TaxID=43658 RepID=A0A5S3UU74_9GAMM|nr:GNAT family N-acetyltransferase [Pseudoalteromonas rubra]QPB82918.1 GNAT family N-acetyltransferase [Pseudoalteromonas rubra]